MQPGDLLRSHIIKRLGQEPEHLDRVIEAFEPVSVDRGEHILRAGEVCRYVYFIVKGVIQVYVINQNGNESTREFYLEDYWVTDIYGFKNQVKSGEFMKALEDCLLLRIHFERFQVLTSEVPEFGRIYRDLLELSYNNTVYRVNTFTSMEARERIIWLHENKPRLMARISSKLIASYLGITPETYTRLKSKV